MIASRIPVILGLLLATGCASASPAPPTNGAPSVAAGTPGTSAAPASPAPSGIGAWEVAGSAPFERLEMAAAAHGDVIWVVGGLNADGSATNEAWRFDPSTGQWEAGPQLPEALHHTALVSTGDELLVIGGYRGSSFSQPTDAVLRLADDAASWESATPLPDARAAGGAAWDGARIIYAGGVAPGGISRDVLSLQDGGWSLVGELSIAREHVSAASDGDGAVWVLGGRQGGLDSNLATVDYIEDGAAVGVGELPTPRGGAAAFHVPGVGACLAGGEEPSRALDAVECIGPDLTVVTLPPLAEPRHGHAAAVSAGAVHLLLGGPEPLLTASDTVQRLALPAP
jgi:hypothetical protein